MLENIHTAALQKFGEILKLNDITKPLPGALPSGELRFIIEIGSSADVTSITKVLTEFFLENPPVMEPLFQSAVSASQNFYVLRFSCNSEDLSQEDIFDVAYALKTLLGLVSCEPDQSCLRTTSSSSAARSNVEGMIAPIDKHWAHKNIRANKAWKMAGAKGEGITIALPDTVVLPHIELEGDAIEAELSRDLIAVKDSGKQVAKNTGGQDATCAAHATAMASLAVSRQAGDIAGSAPRAQIVALTSAASDSDFNTSAMARAIEEAVMSGCTVIAIGRSGCYSKAIEVAIEWAIQRGVIVLAAAGDDAGSVSYPARYPGVAAVGGSTINDVPSAKSSSGKHVSFVAPAEMVWTAEGSSEYNAVSPHDGTGLAVALSAGAAALWLSHNGFERLTALATERGCSVQQLFIGAVCYTARRPNKWDHSRYGAGILDCEALVKLPPENIPEEVEPTSLMPEQIGTIVSLIQESTGQIPNVSEINIAEYSTEICALAYRSMSIETDGSSELLGKSSNGSKSLKLAIEISNDRALGRLVG